MNPPEVTTNMNRRRKYESDVEDSELEEDSSVDLDDVNFAVERILDKRVRNGVNEYYLKWKGYPDEDNTWEPEGNLDCPDLIVEFERLKKKEEKAKREDKLLKKNEVKKKKEDEKKREKCMPSSSSVAVKQELSDESARNTDQTLQNEIRTIQDFRPRGFERHLLPKAIIGAASVDGEVYYLLTWHGTDEADLITAKVARAKCPNIVIDFHERKNTRTSRTRAHK